MVAKWRNRATVKDLKTGPREPRSTVLTEAGEAMIVAFRRHTLLPLDDCLHALQPSNPHLTRLALRRCLQRHGVSRLPDVEAPSRDIASQCPAGPWICASTTISVRCLRLAGRLRKARNPRALTFMT